MWRALTEPWEIVKSFRLSCGSETSASICTPSSFLPLQELWDITEEWTEEWTRGALNELEEERSKTLHASDSAWLPYSIPRGPDPKSLMLVEKLLDRMASHNADSVKRAYSPENSYEEIIDLTKIFKGKLGQLYSILIADAQFRSETLFEFRPQELAKLLLFYLHQISTPILVSHLRWVFKSTGDHGSSQNPFPAKFQ